MALRGKIVAQPAQLLQGGGGTALISFMCLITPSSFN